MYYKELESILFTQKPKEKIKKFELFYSDFLDDKYDTYIDYTAPKLKKPSYEGVLDIVLPKDVLIRKHFDTLEGKITLLHTIAHIEYSAIDLAIDAALRFTKMPKQYYCDWLEVADDEIRHFTHIIKLLEDVGSFYGDQSVHTNLFEAMKNTSTLLDRMAIVPRYLEANGLDQNPKIMKKLQSNPDNFNKKLLDLLNIILKEEVDHVRKGDVWFKYECNRLGLEPEKTYLEILEKYYPGSTSKHQKMNFDARKEAGFSCDELKRLSNQKDCF